MKTSSTPQEMPFGLESGSINNVQKKYYTADEAVAFLEPRIQIGRAHGLNSSHAT